MSQKQARGEKCHINGALKSSSFKMFQIGSHVQKQCFKIGEVIDSFKFLSELQPTRTKACFVQKTDTKDR